MNWKSMLVCLGLVTAAVANAQTTKDEEITVMGVKRQMRVHVPKNVPGNAPLVISMHGLNQDPEYQMNTTNWNAISDTARCIVVYPRAINLSWDISGDTDVNFIKAIINNMYSRYAINKNRVYATGFSMGGMMTYHLITKMADKIAAFGPVSGIPVDNRNPSGKRHVPLIHHHGNKDDVVKFEGDPYHPAGGYRPITDYVTAWAKWNGCDMTKPTVKKVGNDVRTTWKNESEGIETIYIVIDNVGHWHSNNQWGGTYTTKEIWNFVRRYSLNGDFSLAPNIMRASPADGSTGIYNGTSFAIAFTEKVRLSDITVTAEGAGQTIDMVITSTGTMSQSLRFKFPEKTDIKGGEYTVHIKNVNSDAGGHKDEFTLKYTVEPYTYTISISDITALVDEYLKDGSTVTIDDVTALIAKYLSQTIN